MAVSPKTIYLEVDEEITSVIEKIRKTEYSNIVLVVPKGASISQSVVNLKLIKRKADELSKTISIVTGDKVARTLAEKIGIAAASNIHGLSAVPEVPAVKEASVREADPLLATSEVIGEKPPVAPVVTEEPEEITITEGSEDEQDAEFESVSLEEGADGEYDLAAPKKKSDNLMPKFPWKKVLLFGGIPVVFLLILAYIYLPRAKATIYMKAESKMVNINIAGDKDANLDTEKAVVPTQIVEATKESSKKFEATGTKDAGTKATGTIEIYLSSANAARTWISGTRISLGSDSSLIYTTDTAVTLAPGSVQSVSVTAVNPGEKYNVGVGKTFSALNDPVPDVSSKTAISGGTTKQVKVVSQSDFDNAKESLSKEATNEATAEFATKSSELKVIEDSKKTEVTSATAIPKVGDEGDNFEITVKLSVKAVAVSLKDLSELVKAEVNRQLGSTLTIVDDGSSTLELKVDSSNLETGKISGAVSTTAYTSVKLDESKIKAELTGLNNTQAANYLQSLDGVDSTKLEYFPPFVRSFPRIKNNIYLVITASDSSRK